MAGLAIDWLVVVYILLFVLNISLIFIKSFTKLQKREILHFLRPVQLRNCTIYN